MKDAVTLSEVISFTRDGEWGNGEPSEGFSQALVIRGTDFENVRRGDLTSLPKRYIRSDILERKRIKTGDTLIETAGGTKDQPTGRSVYIAERIIKRASLPLVCASFARFLRPDETKIDPNFLFWKLQDEYHSGRILPFHVQHTGVARFQYTQFAENHKMELFALAEQESIAAVLTSLDDKIELNRRMNETLEAMARAIFKDWFVDFGPTRAKMEGRAPYLAPDIWSFFPDNLDSTGKPEGWSERRIDDILELAYGKALKASERIDGSIPVYGSGGITGYHNEALVEGPSIIVGRKGSVGTLYWEDKPFFPIDTVFYVKPRVPLTFCYYLLQTLGLEAMNTDAAVPGLNRNNVYRLPVPWSSENLRLQFNGMVKPFREKMMANSDESQTLAATRDLLLPKLMSGEIRIKDAEKIAGEAA